jgi:hypothetical protein
MVIQRIFDPLSYSALMEDVICLPQGGIGKGVYEEIIITCFYSTVTDFARFLGWSTLHPLNTAIW